MPWQVMPAKPGSGIGMLFLHGQEKKNIIKHIEREGDAACTRYPAARIRASGQVVVIVGESANRK